MFIMVQFSFQNSLSDLLCLLPWNFSQIRNNYKLCDCSQRVFAQIISIWQKQNNFGRLIINNWEKINMLKVSTDCLVFHNPEQRARSITFTNTHESNAFIYKVKTNNLTAIEATPNCGFIRAKSALSLLVKTITSDPFEAKLQIIYGGVGEKTNDFNTSWANLKSEDIKKEQVKIMRSSEKMRSQLKIDSNSLDLKGSQFQSIPQLDRVESVHAINNFELQQKLREKNLENLRMRQQIEITEQKLKEINQQRLQIKVNKSIGIICEEYHTSFTTLLLYGLAVFVLGYALAK